MNPALANLLIEFALAFVQQQQATSAAGNHPQAVANLGILGMFLSMLAPVAAPVVAPAAAATTIQPWPAVPPGAPVVAVLSPLQQLLAGLVTQAVGQVGAQLHPIGPLTQQPTLSK
jgi:hypothetical protein